MSRPTAAERTQARAQNTKALNTYVEICMVLESLAGVITREYSRFGDITDIGDRLTNVGILLEQVRRDAEKRTRQS